jgi:2-polyprenyl-3-methyl-5-hydroxy-6-metoxy-1,4-benzoquinol methylase
MNLTPPSDLTVAYYDAHAREYARDTVNVDMAPVYKPFLTLVPCGGHILDVGCGSGRDTLAFLRRGFRVTAIDPSVEMARLASEQTREAVAVLRVQDLNYENEFDGVWACASLLHVPGREMDDVLGRLTGALHPGGICYMSFKQGESEEFRHGRLFKDYTEPGLWQLVQRHPQLTLLRVWLTEDMRPEQSGRKWVNGLMRKRQ